MITDDDIRKLRKTFATKDDLRYLKEDMEAAMDRQKKLIEEIDKKASARLEEAKNEIIEQIADVVGNGIQLTLDDHEGRIKKVEKRVFATT